MSRTPPTAVPLHPAGGVTLPGGRRAAMTALKVALTAVLCALIARGVEWPAFWASVSSVDPGSMMAVLTLHAVGLSLSSEKWGQILRVHGARVRTGLLVRWYFVAGFANHFLPSSIGGDSYRIIKTRRLAGSAPRATLAILEERITGLAGLLLLGYLFCLPGYGSTRPHLLDVVAVGGTVAVMVCVAAALGTRALSHRVRFTLPPRLARVVNPLRRNARDFSRHRGRTALVALISLLFHLNKIVLIWLILLALGHVAPFAQVAVGILVVEVVGILPVSLGGLGLMEGTFMVVMGEFGLDPAVALAAMLLLRASLLPIAGVGAVIYLSGDRTEHAPA